MSDSTLNMANGILAENAKLHAQVKELQKQLEARDAQIAALAAQEPVGYLIESVHPDSGRVTIHFSRNSIDSISPEDVEEHEMSEHMELFTRAAPPVPLVVKQWPRYKTPVYPTEHRENDKINSWNEAVEACSDALRAAGGSVADE